jgi:predicted nucleic acid-binding protein
MPNIWEPLNMPFIHFLLQLCPKSNIEVIHISKEIDTKAWELLINRQDKEWSLVDCSSFIVMQDRKITESLTNDHHFEQAGFIRLLK